MFARPRKASEHLQRVPSIRMGGMGCGQQTVAAASIHSRVKQHWHCWRSLASATSAHQAASSRRSSERLPSEHTRASDGGECRESAGACLHKHSCRSCSWRICMPQCPSAGDSRPSRAHAAHLMAVLSSPWVVCPQTFKSRKAGPGLSPPCGQHDHLRHAVAKIGPSFSPRPDQPTPVS